jgi:hypothetical protein
MEPAPIAGIFMKGNMMPEGMNLIAALEYPVLSLLAAMIAVAKQNGAHIVKYGAGEEKEWHFYDKQSNAPFGVIQQNAHKNILRVYAQNNDDATTKVCVIIGTALYATGQSL